MKKGIIFDLDGVLIDSEGISFRALQETVKDFGISLTEEDRKLYTGETTPQIIKYLAQKYKKRLDEKMLLEKKERIYEKLAKNNLKKYDDVEIFLKKVKDKKIATAIASSGEKEKVGFNLKESRLNGFDIIINGNDIVNSKPNPEIFLKAAQKLGLKPEECIVIEDSINGVEAAKRAKMKCIAITHTFKRSELKKADIIVDSLNEINLEAL